jgi:transposase
MDVGKLLGQLIRYRSGERKVWSVVRVPSPKDEDDRQLHRELSTLKKERTRGINRIKGLLASQGVRLSIKADFAQRLESVRSWDGSALLPRLRLRLVREFERLEFVGKQIRELERQRVQEIRHSQDPKVEQVRALMRLNGIGVNSSWQFIMEFFGWREFRSGKEVGGLSGLAPTPYQSGSSYREQGMSKAGNRHVRAMAIEIAWGWLGYQPESELTRWYEHRFGQGSKRIRKIGIVALARRLLVELWRYLETGAIPAGAVLKTRLI